MRHVQYRVLYTEYITTTLGTWKFGVESEVEGTEVPLFNISVKDPDSNIHGTNMGPVWDLQDPGGSHIGPMNFAIWGYFCLNESDS